MTDRRVHELAIDVGGRTYPILIGEGLLADRRVHERCVRASDVLVVTDRNVAPLYLELVRAATDASRRSCCPPVSRTRRWPVSPRSSTRSSRHA
jgi:3-dehydroquinate synthetase